jgi:rubrerythrin
MLSQTPIDLSKIDKKNLDREICRLGMIAELDATSLYEQLAQMTSSSRIKNILLDIAKEEKTHTGEFQALLLEIDKEQAEENKAGADEVAEKA